MGGDTRERQRSPRLTSKKDRATGTGDEPMTGAQASYLQMLCEEAGEEFDPNLTKAATSKRIDALQHKTGRGETR